MIYPAFIENFHLRRSGFLKKELLFEIAHVIRLLILFHLSPNAMMT
jgi:hypothetical protein